MRRFLLSIICIFLVSIYSYFDNTTPEAEKLLWTGITNSNMEMVDDAIASGCNLDSFSAKSHRETTSHGSKTSNPVTIALFRGEFEIAKKLIESGADVNKRVDIKKRTILHYSVERSAEITEKLILLGADVNAEDKYGETPLDFSLKATGEKTFPETFYILMDNNAHFAEKDINDILAYIKYEQYGPVREMLNQKECKSIDTVLKSAFFGDNVSVINNSNKVENKKLLQQLTSAFCDASTLKSVLNNDSDYSKLLKCSVLYNNIDTTEYILSYCTENAKDFSSKELTYCMIKSGDISMLKLLCENGITFSMQDIVLGTIQYNQVEILEYFITQGLDVNFETGIGSPIAIATKENKIDMINMLLQRGADVNGNANTGIPLIIACKEGYIDIVRTLIDAGADIDIVYKDSNKKHITALITSVYHGNYECVSVLLEKGADTKFLTDNGNTVYDIATDMGMNRIQKMLNTFD